MRISVVVPVLNEEENIPLLTTIVKETLEKLTSEYEIIFIDDGSTDGTFSILLTLAKFDPKVKVIRFTRNFGQSAAMNAGFKHATGDIIVTMDGDLQNDPSDIPRMIDVLNRGYDVVCGWRYNRRDPSLRKILPSLLAGFVRKVIAKDRIHDSGCTLKVYRSKAVKNLKLLGETHRFIPLMLQWQGFKVVEVKVRHHTRKHGQTKYGVKRLWRGFFDLIGLLFWEKYATKPLHMFGAIGLISITFSFMVLFYVFLMTMIQEVRLLVGPLLLFSVVLFLGGLQIFFIGVLAEMQTKVYYANKEQYEIEQIVICAASVQSRDTSRRKI